MAIIQRKNRYISGFSTVNAEATRQKTYKRYDEEAIKRDLLNRFMTRKGERIMLPDYGSIVWDLIMEPMTDGTREAIIKDCIEQVDADGRLEIGNLNMIEITNGYRIDMLLKFLPFSSIGEFSLDIERTEQ